MKQITEDYCSFEIAKLLKEKGFDEPCWNYYDLKLEHYFRPVKNKEWPLNRVSAPTHQMVLKWMREVHKIHVVIYPYADYSCDNYQFDVYKDGKFVVSKDYGYINYEQAVEAALKYTLENLI